MSPWISEGKPVVKPLVIAHRGAGSLAPENTMAAARLAYDIGADRWETDINITKDRKLVLHHDRDLIRCTDVKKKYPGQAPYLINQFTLDELNRLDAGAHFERTDPFSQILSGKVGKNMLNTYIGEPIPTLSQALEFTKNANWQVNLELKYFKGFSDDDFIPEETIKIIHSSGIDFDRVFISSFHHPWLEKSFQNLSTNKHPATGRRK
jgi:glycerophosphoryl diester phosphodiesterase